jgi:hypothetical protein
VALVDVLVDVFAFALLEGVSEAAGVIEMAIEADSYMMPS